MRQPIDPGYLAECRYYAQEHLYTNSGLNPSPHAQKGSWPHSMRMLHDCVLEIDRLNERVAQLELQAVKRLYEVHGEVVTEWCAPDVHALFEDIFKENVEIKERLRQLVAELKP